MIPISELTSRLAEKRTEVAVCAGLAVFVGLLFSAPGNSLERFAFDLFHLLTPVSPPKDVIIVRIDEKSAKRYGVDIDAGQTWPRILYANLLDYLKKDGAKVAALDLDLQENKDIAGDKALSNSIVNFNQSGKVVCAVTIEDVRGIAKSQKKIASNLKDAFGEENLGSHLLDPEKDEARGHWVRRHREGDEFSSLGWLAAEAYDEGLAKSDAARRKSRWIRFYGRAGAVRSMSYEEVFEKAKRGYFTNKIVFIGNMPPPNTSSMGKAYEEYGTPATRWDPDRRYFSGVEIHATICLNLLHNHSIREIGGNLYYLLVLMTGTFFGMILTLLKEVRRKLLFTALAAVAILALALFAFWALPLWINWPPIAAVQLPVACATSLICYAVRKEDETKIYPVPLALWPPRDLELLQVIGQGSFGKVWLARNKVTGAFVALKKIELADRDEFVRELQGVSNFHPICGESPNWVRVLTVVADKEADCFYYTMEPADDILTGQKIVPERYTPKTLRAWIEHNKWLPVPECIDVGMALCEGLGALHRCGYIHRDIKPSNFIYVRNIPKLADVGLVVSSDQTISFCGTENYIPPERQSSRLADVYALGMVLYEMVTGARPSEFPRFPTSIVGRNDKSEVMLLMEVIDKACSKEPGERYQRCENLRDDLKRIKETLDRGPADTLQMQQTSRIRNGGSGDD